MYILMKKVKRKIIIGKSINHHKLIYTLAYDYFDTGVCYSIGIFCVSGRLFWTLDIYLILHISTCIVYLHVNIIMIFRVSIYCNKFLIF